MVGQVQKSNVVLLAENRTSRAFAAAGREADGLAKKYGGVSLSTVGIAAAATAAAAAIVVMTKRSLDNADAIGKAADAIGIGVEELQEYRFAAELSGVATEKFDQSLLKFTKSLGEARQDTGSLAEFLKKYDTNLLAAINSTNDTGEALDVVLRAMAGTADQTDRAALSAAAFGRSGVVMTNILRDGTRGLEAMRQEARDLGIVLDESMVREAEAANDALTRMQRVVGVNFQKLFLTLAPTIERMGIAFGAAAPAIAEATEELVKFFGGVELLGIEALRRELGDLEKQLKRLSTPEGLERAARIDPTGANRRALEEQIESTKELIEVREQEAEARKAVFAAQVAGQTEANDNELKATQRLLDNIAEARLRAADDEEALLQRKLDKTLAALDAAELAEAEKRAAKLIAEETFELERDELRREREERRKEEQLEREDADRRQLLDFRIAANELTESVTAQHFANLVQQTATSSAAMARIWKTGFQGQLEVLSSVFGAAASLMESKSKTMFKIGKGFAIAQATIDTFRAANGAYSALSWIPLVGPALGAAAAAAAIAAGIINVKKIASQKFGGGGSSSGGGGGSVSAGGTPSLTPPGANLPDLAAQAAAQPARQINLTIESDSDLVSLDWVRNNLIPTLNEALDDGTVLNVQAA